MNIEERRNVTLNLAEEVGVHTDVKNTGMAQMNRFLEKKIFRNHLQCNHIPSLPQLSEFCKCRNLSFGWSEGEMKWGNLDYMYIYLRDACKEALP